jgi:hypothetical protein
LVWASRWSPSLGLLQSVWPSPVPSMPGPRSFVAAQDGRPVGLAQMTPRREPQQWDVVYLGLAAPPAADRDGLPPLRLIPDRRATRLLGELCDASVELGATRLFARVAEDGEGYEMFRQVGFTPVVSEFTYFRETSTQRPAPAHGTIAGLRPQRRADAFLLKQLYQETNPKVVQMAEGKLSTSFESAWTGLTGFGGRLSRHARERRWVVERDSRLVAWLHASRQPRGPYVVRLMLDEREADLAQSLLDLALTEAAANPAPGVIVRVREYQHRVVRALEEAGFDLLEANVLMVKQLAIPALQPQFGRVLEKVV